MDKIEVAVLHESHSNPEGMMMFLARLTQRGHSLHNMDELKVMYNECVSKKDWKSSAQVAALPHGTITRFTPITVAVYGASRRFLAQIRTHQVGANFVSASLQYSDYTDQGDFVVPYAIIEHDANAIISGLVLQDESLSARYLEACKESMGVYKVLAHELDNDTAGYVAPQGLRNILIIQANVESWKHIIQLRTCNRNTAETQYVMCLIWDALLKTQGGKQLFGAAGPDCVYGHCREGKFCCGKPFCETTKISEPQNIIRTNWPYLYKGEK